MHSVALTEDAMAADAETLAQGILVTSEVSYLKALMEIRAEIVAAGFTPSAEIPTAEALRTAASRLRDHELRQRNS